MVKVLVADDERHFCSALGAWLAQKPEYQIVGEVHNLNELLAQTEHNAPIDMLLLDWDLPGLVTDKARQQLIRHLRKAFQQLRIVVLSAKVEVEEQALKADIDAFVSKSESPDQFRRHFADTSLYSEGVVGSVNSSGSSSSSVLARVTRGVVSVR
jgi:DNA-binding NarL/FixJ family response regulator